jgi:hypothetical protein
MNSLDGPEAVRREANFLRAQNERLRREIDGLLAWPAYGEDQRSVRALRWAITALWIVGALSAVVLAVAVVIFLAVARGGLKG